MYDQIVRLGDSVVQHGPFNDRIYLMKLGVGDIAKLAADLDSLAEEKGYSKIIGKIPAGQTNEFKKNGYRIEASIPDFYSGKGDAAFIAKYPKKARRKESNPGRTEEILALAREKAGQGHTATDISPLKLGVAGQGEDAEQMSLVYREVFETYPFPIHDPAYLRKTMASHVQYFYVRDGNRFVALSSAEMDKDSNNVEMTDFATLPSYRGRGLAVILLDTMEFAMKRRGMNTAYTIARSLSAGMNITFSKMGYAYAGTLTNNTNISGNIESMNVWYKSLV